MWQQARLGGSRGRVLAQLLSNRLTEANGQCSTLQLLVGNGQLGVQKPGDFFVSWANGQRGLGNAIMGSVCHVLNSVGEQGLMNINNKYADVDPLFGDSVPFGGCFFKRSQEENQHAGGLAIWINQLNLCLTQKD